MKAYMLITGSGPIVILTSHDSVLDSALVRKLAGKGIDKFIGYEIPIGLARERYGAHFALVQGDLRESDDLRVLDYDGSRAFKLFRFDELGAPLLHEPSLLEQRKADVEKLMRSVAGFESYTLARSGNGEGGIERDDQRRAARGQPVECAPASAITAAPTATLNRDHLPVFSIFHLVVLRWDGPALCQRIWIQIAKP